MKNFFEKFLTVLKIFTPRNGFLIFLAGLFILLVPYLYSWSLVVFPLLSLLLLILIILGVQEVIVFVTLILSAFYTLSTLALNTSIKTKVFSVCFFVVLITTFLTSKPDYDFRNGGSAFLLGAQTRLAWAGGSEKVKTDALRLLTQQPDESGLINSELWSNSLKRTGATRIYIDKESQSVAIFIPAGNGFSDFDEFGYLFTYDRVPNVAFLKIEGYGLVIHYWKLADGVYFFNREW
ncbi:MAG: hypothetical protein HY869_17000 [Chloroflexi bacterium]|nr:hypothetical protein [Chloroflexota bacterium]